MTRRSHDSNRPGPVEFRTGNTIYPDQHPDADGPGSTPSPRGGTSHPDRRSCVSKSISTSNGPPGDRANV